MTNLVVNPDFDMVPIGILPPNYEVTVTKYTDPDEFTTVEYKKVTTHGAD